MNQVELKIMNNLDINSQVKNIEPNTLYTSAKITNEDATQFEKDLVTTCINKTKFADELLLNSAPVFLPDHFKSKRVALFRALIPTTMSGAQMTPEFLADYKFLSSIFDGSFVEVIPEGDYARPNKRTARFKITCANWLILNLNAEISEFKPDDLRDIGRILGGAYKYIRGFLAEKTGKEQVKNMPIFKLKKYILLREDGMLDMFVICVLNNTMLLKTAEVFISKFLDKAWGNLAKQVATKVNTPLEGVLLVAKLKDVADYDSIAKSSFKNNSEKGLSGFIALYESSWLQYIEGNRESVITIRKRIEADDRQIECIKILQGSLKTRLCPDGWSNKLVVRDEHISLQTEYYQTLLNSIIDRDLS